MFFFLFLKSYSLLSAPKFSKTIPFISGRRRSTKLILFCFCVLSSLLLLSSVAGDQSGIAGEMLLLLSLLLLVESRVGLFDEVRFGLAHLLLHPGSDGGDVSINTGLLLIAASDGPRRQADEDVAAVGALTSQRRSTVDLHRIQIAINKKKIKTKQVKTSKQASKSSSV